MIAQVFGAAADTAFAELSGKPEQDQSGEIRRAFVELLAGAATPVVVPLPPPPGGVHLSGTVTEVAAEGGAVPGEKDAAEQITMAAPLVEGIEEVIPESPEVSAGVPAADENEGKILQVRKPEMLTPGEAGLQRTGHEAPLDEPAGMSAGKDRAKSSQPLLVAPDTTSREHVNRIEQSELVKGLLRELKGSSQPPPQSFHGEFSRSRSSGPEHAAVGTGNQPGVRVHGITVAPVAGVDAGDGGDGSGERDSSSNGRGNDSPAGSGPVRAQQVTETGTDSSAFARTVMQHLRTPGTIPAAPSGARVSPRGLIQNRVVHRNPMLSRVTLSIPDAGGSGSTRVRLMVIGDAVRATITSDDPGTVDRLSLHVKELKNSLARSGFSEASLAVRPVRSDAAHVSQGIFAPSAGRGGSDGPSDDGMMGGRTHHNYDTRDERNHGRRRHDQEREADQ